MTNNVLSIEIGIQTTRVCEVDYEKKNPHVYHCITFDTPQGVIEDGFIRDASTLATVLREKLSTHNVENKKVVFTIASTKIANREVVIPIVKDNRIQDVVSANASDYFPVNVEDCIITYSILERIKTKDEKQLRLLVLAAPSNLIQSYYEFSKIMDFDVMAIDYIGNSSYQLIKRQVSVGTNLIIQLNEQTTLITILKDDTLMLQRTVPYGTDQVIRSILESGEFNAHNTKEALEVLVREHMINVQFGFPSQNVIPKEEDINSPSFQKQLREMRAKEEVTETFKYLINNVNRVLDYYLSKDPTRKIDAIYLAGQGAKFRGISHLFRNQISFEVKKFDRLYAVNFNKNVDVAGLDESEYLSCIGATVQPVGFIPKESLVKEKKKSNLVGIAMISGAVVVGAVLLVVSSGVLYLKTNSQKNHINSKINELSYIEEVYKQHEDVVKKLDQTNALYKLTKTNNEQLGKILLDFEKLLPKSTRITQLESDDVMIKLNIDVPNKKEAAKAILQLEQMEEFSLVTTDGIVENKDEESDKKILKYTISCVFKVDDTDSTTDENAVPAE